VDRHKNKLKRSHGRGNRFTITIRSVPPGGAARAQAVLDGLRETGVPNIFGAQRFGHDGDNVQRGLAILRGEERAPKNRRIRSILESAIQSEAFNKVFELRLERGLFNTALMGDIMKKHDTGGLFDVTGDIADVQARLDRREISTTAPLPGKKTRDAAGVPLELERAALDAVGLSPNDLAKMELGTRRALRFPLEPSAEVNSAGEDSYTLSITLPSGAYATVVLAELIKPESGVITR
jgi:tRNA pseudouridine13 synthase